MIPPRRRLSVLIVLLGCGAALEARASSRYCWGAMMFEDCQLATDHVWPANSSPTFGAVCDFCPGGDAGACMRGAPLDTIGFAIQVDGQNVNGGQFERLGKLCGEQALFRYSGPLMPGKLHRIYLAALPGLSGQQQPIFEVGPPVVTEEPREAGVPPEPASDPGPPEAAPGARDAAAVTGDVAGDATAVRAAGEGCDCALSARDDGSHRGTLWMVSLGVALALLRRRRRP